MAPSGWAARRAQMCVLDGNCYDAKCLEAGQERDDDLDACSLLTNNKAQPLLAPGNGGVHSAHQKVIVSLSVRARAVAAAARERDCAPLHRLGNRVLEGAAATSPQTDGQREGPCTRVRSASEPRCQSWPGQHMAAGAAGAPCAAPSAAPRARAFSLWSCCAQRGGRR